MEITIFDIVIGFDIGMGLLLIFYKAQDLYYDWRYPFSYECYNMIPETWPKHILFSVEGIKDAENRDKKIH